jgi:hypothetical protein
MPGDAENRPGGPHAGHPALRVRRQNALRLIQDDQVVAEGIANARASANRDIERGLNGFAARAQEEREGLVDILNQNIGFRADVQVHELGVGVGKGKADRLLASPQHAMPKLIAIERYRRIEVGDAKQTVIELAKQRPPEARGQAILRRTQTPPNE